MAKQSLEQTIAQEMGRDAFRLFTTDEEFKNAKTFEELHSILKKRSNNKIETTLPTLQRMIMNWISSNKCKISDFEKVLKAEKESKGHKGKISFRETLESYFKVNIWDYFRSNLKACDGVSSALSVILHESKNKVQVSEATLKRTIESGIEAKEFSSDSFWINWIPKKRHHKTEEEKEAEQKALHNYTSVVSRAECKKCGWVGLKPLAIYDKNCILGLKACRCPKCAKWASLIVDFSVFDKKVRITNTVDEDGCVNENFIDQNGKIIPNPFFLKKEN